MKDILTQVISGLGLVWAIYQFVIKRMDDRNKEKQMEISNAIKSAKENMDKEMHELKLQLKHQEKEFEKMKLTVVSLSSQTKSQGQVFNETSKRIEKVLDRHEDKLDNFGKVILKD